MVMAKQTYARLERMEEKLDKQKEKVEMQKKKLKKDEMVTTIKSAVKSAMGSAKKPRGK